jgi:hypothetical protein
MHLWVLAGLLPLEKHQLAQELVQHWGQQGQSVALFDQGLAYPLAGAIRLSGALLPQMATLLQQQSAPAALLIVAENSSPGALYADLDELQLALPAVTIRILALVDERTQACFPQVGDSWEQIAATVIPYPYSLAEVVMRWLC